MKWIVGLGIATVLVLNTAESARANLIQDPGFEQGSSQTDWTFNNGSVSTTNPHTGRYSALLNQEGSVSQAVSAAPGTYSVSFWVFDSAYYGCCAKGDSLSVTLGNSSPVTFNNWGSSYGLGSGWREGMGTLTTTESGSQTVTFLNTRRVHYMYLDDVSLVPATSATPEPASLTLLGLGAGSLGLCAWRRRRQGGSNAGV